MVCVHKPSLRCLDAPVQAGDLACHEPAKMPKSAWFYCLKTALSRLANFREAGYMLEGSSQRCMQLPSTSEMIKDHEHQPRAPQCLLIPDARWSLFAA